MFKDHRNFKLFINDLDVSGHVTEINNVEIDYFSTVKEALETAISSNGQRFFIIKLFYDPDFENLQSLLPPLGSEFTLKLYDFSTFENVLKDTFTLQYLKWRGRGYPVLDTKYFISYLEMFCEVVDSNEY